MSKFIQAASLVALAATASTAGAWYSAPYQPPVPTQEQQQTMVKQHEAMIEQRTKAMEEAFAAQRQFAEQQVAYFEQLAKNDPGMPPRAGRPFGPDMTFPEAPPMPEFGQYPSMPEMPPLPEFGQYPAMPPMPEFGQYPAMPPIPAMSGESGPGAFGPESFNESFQARIKEMDAYRAQATQRMEERRAAMKAMHEQRRAMRASGRRAFDGASDMRWPMPPAMGGIPAAAPQQQAAAPTDPKTVTR